MVCIDWNLFSYQYLGYKNNTLPDHFLLGASPGLQFYVHSQFSFRRNHGFLHTPLTLSCSACFIQSLILWYINPVVMVRDSLCLRPLISWDIHSAIKRDLTQVMFELAWYLLEWKRCLHASTPLIYSPDIYICLRYMLVFWHSLQCNIQFRHCTLNAACIELSIHLKHKYVEPSFLVEPYHIHHTMDQCAGLWVSDDFWGSKLYLSGYCNKNIILFTNMMSSDIVTFM